MNKIFESVTAALTLIVATIALFGVSVILLTYFILEDLYKMAKGFYNE
jgi:hypothetical protein